MLATQEKIPLRLTARRKLTAKIIELQFQHAEGSDLPRYQPGAHIDVEVKLAGDRIESGSYSLVNGPQMRDFYLVAVQREEPGSGGSLYMHNLNEGDLVNCSVPINDFELSWSAQQHVLVAGGIGVTPILSMTRHLMAAMKPFEVYYAGREIDAMAYIEEFKKAGNANIVIDHGDPRNGLDLDAILTGRSPGTHVYVCGPTSLIENTLLKGKQHGLVDHQLHYELFQPQKARHEMPSRVFLKRAGRWVDVPTGTSILDALIAAGIDALYDCRRGECGLCVTNVISGTPEHHDFTLTEAERMEGRVMCICVSRARTDELVLDL